MVGSINNSSNVIHEILKEHEILSEFCLLAQSLTVHYA